MKKCIFIDESGFNLHLHRSMARSKIGSRAKIVLPTIRGRNVSLVVQWMHIVLSIQMLLMMEPAMEINFVHLFGSLWRSFSRKNI